ncbi:hypothetical protein [Psychrobacter jeotgali]|uniref:hypothetical protein n=1 Tax=Psychrobacter jeotgali TaxID=179010 RepID=UPI001918A638|nr:hypothetical protein [Psychrobacter jeotgali]
MTIKRPTFLYYWFYISIWLTLSMSSVALFGCKPQPKSPFEQQAETNSNNGMDISVSNQAVESQVDDEVAIVTEVTPVVTENAADKPIQITKQQAIARQPNCDPSQKACQYFELNILDFTPQQPWLTSIMWQTIVRVVAPQAPLVSQDETAKKTVLMLLNQVEYSETMVSSLPLYQRIETEVVFNPATPDTVDTGYLVIRSNQQRGTDRQHINYVMLDMQKKLQLNIKDILLPEVSTAELLTSFQNAKKQWLMSQGVEQQYLDEWPLHLSRQWYLDEQGLHMVYQSGELLKSSTDAVDLIVPYELLEGLIKPNYKISYQVDS